MILNTFISRIPILRRFYKENSGAVTVEMTLLFIPFMALFLFIGELCVTVYISVSIDVAMAEAMRYTAASANPTVGTYEQIFRENIKQRINGFPFLSYKESKVDFSTAYCIDLEQVAGDTCTGTVPSELYPVATFAIKYTYDPIFLPFMRKLFENDMARKGIFVMENQRVRK